MDPRKDPRYAELAAEIERRRAERRARMAAMRALRDRQFSEGSRPSVETETPEEIIESIQRHEIVDDLLLSLIGET